MVARARGGGDLDLRGGVEGGDKWSQHVLADRSRRRI